jgi:hypothetical protein
MTDAQRKRLFFPARNEACRRLGWRMSDGRLDLLIEKLNNHSRRVVAAAVARADAEHRAAVLDDLRHGCYIVALGRDRQTNRLSNAEVDKVVSLFKLLVDDTDIAADQRLNNPEIAERECLVRKIHALRIPETVIDGVCKKAFAPVYNSPFFEDLPLVNLRTLVAVLIKVKDRGVRTRELPEAKLL